MILSVQVFDRAGDGEAARFWRNTHEVDMGALSTFDPVKATAIGNAFASFHRALLCNYFSVDRVVVSEYAGATLLTPDNFVSLPVNLPGLRATATFNTLGIHTCMVVRRDVERGRYGRMWLRGYLREDDVVGGSGGQQILTVPATNQTEVDNASTAMVTILTAQGGSMVVARGDEPFVAVRDVTGWTVSGVANRKLRRRVKTLFAGNPSLRAMGEALDAVSDSPELVNAVLTAFNLLPLPDVPLLPG